MLVKSFGKFITFGSLVLQVLEIPFLSICIAALRYNAFPLKALSLLLSLKKKKRFEKGAIDVKEGQDMITNFNVIDLRSLVALLSTSERRG